MISNVFFQIIPMLNGGFRKFCFSGRCCIFLRGCRRGFSRCTIFPRGMLLGNFIRIVCSVSEGITRQMPVYGPLVLFYLDSCAGSLHDIDVLYDRFGLPTPCQRDHGSG